MSQLGQSRRFDPPPTTSGIPQTSDIIMSAELVRLVPIVLQKSKIEGPRKFRKSGFLADSTAATLRRSDTRLGGRFSEKRMVPHVSARKAHWRSLEFSVVATKRLFQQYPHKTDLRECPSNVRSRGQRRHRAARSPLPFLTQAV